MIEFVIFGMKIRIHFLFVAVVTIFLLTDEKNVAMLSLFAAIIHEIAHILMFFVMGAKPTSLDFLLTGMRLEAPILLLPFKKDLAIQLAGCAMNFLLFAIFSYSTSAVSNVSIFAVCHLVIGTFNLLPLKNFDGGKILFLILSKIMPINKVIRFCGVTDNIFKVLLIFFGGVFCFWQFF